MERTRTLMILAAALANAAACVGSPYDDAPAAKATPNAKADATPTANADAKPVASAPEFVRVPESVGEVDALVREAKVRAEAESRRLVVYVGASWCEPCQRFHEAVERGELDGALANVRFLEFDADRHTPALDAAGYGGRLIPRFAMPGGDGRGTEAKIEGGPKGDAAVPQILKRLEQLLAT
jgi:hypothetical protein